MFTNVPLEDLIYFMKDYFKKCDFPVGLEDLLELIKLCVCDAKFCVLMESFISKSLAWLWEIVYHRYVVICTLEFFERNLLTTILPNHVKWFLYVDDVLCLWPKSMNL